MREIEFRGKDIKTKEWHYGSLVSQYDVEACLYCQYHIVEKSEYSRSCDWDNALSDVDFYIVDEDTLGQFTGLCDKNDKEVYEGDIIRMHYFFDNYDPETLGAFEDEAEIIGVVKCELLDGFYVETVDDHSRCYLQWVEEPTEELEVLGNIYDNPELLEKE